MQRISHIKRAITARRPPSPLPFPSTATNQFLHHRINILSQHQEKRHIHSTRMSSFTPFITPNIASPAIDTSSTPSSSSHPAATISRQDSDRAKSDDSNGGHSWSTKIGIAFFLSTAAFALYLGVWQVKRRAWKKDLIERRTAALSAPPVDLHTYLLTHPSKASSSSDTQSEVLVGDAATAILEASDQMCRVSTRGRFLYDRTQILGPRNPPSADASSTAGKGVGYYLITPFVLETGETILVNRGWCSKDKLHISHEGSSDSDILSVTGVIRKGETRPQFLADYDPQQGGSFIYLDLENMAKLSGVPKDSNGNLPILIDALEVEDNKNRNMKRKSVSEYIVFTTTPTIHTVYATTWFTLSAALVALTYVRFGKKFKIPKTISATARK